MAVRGIEIAFERLEAAGERHLEIGLSGVARLFVVGSVSARVQVGSVS